MYNHTGGQPAALAYGDEVSMETKTIAQIQSEGYTVLGAALGQRGCNPVYPEL
jgi:hypothetical protein